MTPQDKTKPTAVPNGPVDDNGNPMYEDPKHPQYQEYLEGVEAGKDKAYWEGSELVDVNKTPTLIPRQMKLFAVKKDGSRVYSEAYTKGVLQSLMNNAKAETNEATQRASRYNTAMAATASSASGALRATPFVGAWLGDWVAEHTFDKIKNEAAATGYRMGDGGRADSWGSTAELVTRIPLEIASFKTLMGMAKGVADKATHISLAKEYGSKMGTATEVADKAKLIAAAKKFSSKLAELSKEQIANMFSKYPNVAANYAKGAATGVWGWLSKHPKMLKTLTHAPKVLSAGATAAAFGPHAVDSVQAAASRFIPSQAYAEWTGAPKHIAEQMIVEQITKERVDADIKEKAAEAYPNDKAKQQEFIRKANQNLANAGAPGYNDPSINTDLDTEYYIKHNIKHDNNKDVGFFTRLMAFLGVDSARQRASAETLYRGMEDPDKQKEVAQALQNSFSNMLKRDSKITDNEASQINGMITHLYDTGKADKALDFIDRVIDTSIQNMDVAALEKLVEFGKRNGGGLEKLGLSPEHAKMLTDRVTKAAQDRGWALFKENPLENTPTLVSLWLQQKGVDSGLSEAVKNPWVFYGGSLALLLGGGALLGSLFQGDDDYDDEDEDYERPRRRRSGYDKGYTHFAQYA